MHDLIDGIRRIPTIGAMSVSGVAVASPRLRDAGCPVQEVLLRDTGALERLAALRPIDGVVAGAGSVLDTDQCRAALAAGARFVVCPGHDDDLAVLCEAAGAGYLPAAATAGEVLRLRRAGFDLQKFFPAAAMGGVATLAALAGPFPDVRFCATGGIDASNVDDYLALANVACVGGSWLLRTV